MGEHRGGAYYVIAFLISMVLSAALWLTTGISIRVIFFVLIFICGVFVVCGNLFLDLWEEVGEAVGPTKVNLPDEADRFAAFSRVADERGGHFQMVGRSGKLILPVGGRELTVTGKVASQGDLLTIRSPLENPDFMIEVSLSPISRGDLTMFETGDDEFDQELFVASNDVDRARAATLHCKEAYLENDYDIFVTCVRGDLEFRLKTDEIDDDILEYAVDVYSWIFESIVEADVEADDRIETRRLSV